MPGVVKVVIVVAVVVLVVVLWFALELLEEQPRRRPGYMDRSPNGSDKPRWRVRPR